MTRHITHEGKWKAGQSGNPKGRPRKKASMTEILKSAGEQRMIIGEKPIMAKEVLAKAVWQLVTTGEVLLSGRLLAVQSVTEWAQVVKWLYAHAEPATQRAVEEQPEMIVRVVREDLAEHESLPLLVPSIDEGE